MPRAIKKRFDLIKVELTPNYPVCTGYLLIAVDKEKQPFISYDDLLPIAAKFFGFGHSRLKVNSVKRIGLLLAMEEPNGYTINTAEGPVTIHVLDYANGEY